MSAALLKATGLTRSYGHAGPPVLHGIDLQVAPGETLGIIGGSGSGKSTLARILMGLERPSAGTVRFRGTDLFGRDRNALRAVRTEIQAVFQDPYGSLDPRHRIGRTVAEPLLGHRLHRAERADRVREALGAVGLPADAAQR